MVQPGVDAANSVAVTAQTPEQQQEAAANGEPTALFGYQLRLVMEYCDRVRLCCGSVTVHSGMYCAVLRFVKLLRCLNTS